MEWKTKRRWKNERWSRQAVRAGKHAASVASSAPKTPTLFISVGYGLMPLFWYIWPWVRTLIKQFGLTQND